MFINYSIHFFVRAEGIGSHEHSCHDHKFFIQAERGNKEQEARADQHAVGILRGLIAGLADQVKGEVTFRSNRSHYQRFKLRFGAANVDRVVELLGLTKGDVVV